MCELTQPSKFDSKGELRSLGPGLQAADIVRNRLGRVNGLLEANKRVRGRRIVSRQTGRLSCLVLAGAKRGFSRPWCGRQLISQTVSMPQTGTRTCIEPKN